MDLKTKETMSIQVDVDLYAGYYPYVSVCVNGMQSFIPFRHTMELYTKSDRHDMWSFDDMDEDEFTPEMRRIREWEWILLLDGNYRHGTMICCNSETIHGSRLSIHSLKDYRGNTNNALHLDISIPLVDDKSKEELRHNVWEIMNKIERDYNRPVTTIACQNMKPWGRVCEYVMDCRRYTH